MADWIRGLAVVLKKKKLCQRLFQEQTQDGHKQQASPSFRTALPFFVSVKIIKACDTHIKITF